MKRELKRGSPGPVRFFLELPASTPAYVLQRIAKIVDEAGGKLKAVDVRYLTPDEEEEILEKVERGWEERELFMKMREL